MKQYVYEPNGNANITNEKDIDIADARAGAIKIYPCMKVNGVKYYKDTENKVFTILNDEKLEQNSVVLSDYNSNGIKYYEEAFKFSEWVKDNLGSLKTSDAVDTNGNPYPAGTFINRNIFKELKNNWKYNTCLEDENSNFNAHKIEVIKNSIETNLMVAIANYNKVSTSGVNFQMPKLKDTDWEELTKNVSMITFLQGLSIGGKVYNGYSIVRNDITEDFVSEDSIYICANNNQYYKVTDPYLLNLRALGFNFTTGIFNVDFERKTTNAIVKKPLGDGTNETITKAIYYYPRADMASYSSIINSNNSSPETNNIQEYLSDAGRFERLR